MAVIGYCSSYIYVELNKPQPPIVNYEALEIPLELIEFKNGRKGDGFR